MSKSINITENERASGVSSSVALATRTITLSSSNYVANGSIVTVDFPTVKTRYNTTSGGRNGIDDSISLRALINGNRSSRGYCSKWAKLGVNTDATLTIGSSSPTSFNFNTSSLFNASNKNDKTIPISWELMAYATPLHTGIMANDGSMTYIGYYDTTQYSTYATITGEGSVTLDAPPTFDTTQVSLNTNGAYVGLTTASITVSNLSIKYGGDIASGYFIVGNQTEPFSENGTVSMLLDSAGTFTPTVTVTDSRGQTTTKTLDPIVVNPYVAPEIAFTLERTNASGTKDDEGTYAVATASFNWTDAIATLSQPTVSAIDSDGTPLSVSATWYTDRVLTTAVDWSSTSSWSSPKTLYGRIGTLPVNESSQVTITPNDSEGSGTAQTQTLASAFYTIDFLAGGHGIAFGQPASEEGFFCNMDSHFSDKANVMRALFDFVYPVGSYYETSDTSFDPNVTWGGTWILETEGQVHVSAGSNYTIAGALTDTTDGGEATHTLTVNELAKHSHRILQANNSGTAGAWVTNASTTNSRKVAYQGGQTYSDVIELSGGSQPHNIMQPYIVVNRWHRTA